MDRGDDLRSACASSTNLELLDKRLVERARIFYRVLQHAGLKPTLTSVVRPPSVQGCLYDRAVSGVSRLPALPPGRSLHGQGLAFDLVVTPPALLERAGALWKAVFDGEWGGDSRLGYDPVHFQAKSLAPGRPTRPDLALGPNPSPDDLLWAIENADPQFQVLGPGSIPAWARALFP